MDLRFDGAAESPVQLLTAWGCVQGGSERPAAPQDTAVYVGIQQMEYGGLAAAHLTSMGAFSATGSPFSVAAGRLSFVYGFHGPAVRPCSAAPSSSVGDLLRVPAHTLCPRAPTQGCSKKPKLTIT